MQRLLKLNLKFSQQVETAILCYLQCIQGCLPFLSICLEFLSISVIKDVESFTEIRWIYASILERDLNNIDLFLFMNTLSLFVFKCPSIRSCNFLYKGIIYVLIFLGNIFKWYHKLYLKLHFEQFATVNYKYE